MKRAMVLGLSHDTCRWCGSDFQMKKNGTLYHHGHPARRCPGTGTFGVRMDRHMAEMRQKYGAQ